MSFEFDHWELDNQVSSEQKISHKKRKVVHYAEKCSVVLIPSRVEYFNAGIDLWYKPKDFSSALNQVQKEIGLLMSIDSSITIQKARIELFQPN
mmetsp:Transcript_32461/g.44491  ORF Transcript_32461/g.44491 Transcript_32461/m.44491 type:complete len:94 (+) Transcript_32461:91-372(+)